MEGRRRPDIRIGEVPDDAQLGDYWKYVDEGGEPLSARAYCGEDDPEVEHNLTDAVWGFYSPDGSGIGTLTHNTVRENEDGTISIRPDDGSPNSVLHTNGDWVWRGYVDFGVWKAR